MRNLFIAICLCSTNIFSMETDLELIKSRLEDYPAIDYLISAKKFNIDESMSFAFNQLFFNAFFPTRNQIINAHRNEVPFYIVIGASMRDGGVPGKRLYLQPSNKSRDKLKMTFDNVFPHTIQEFCEAIGTLKVPLFYANNIFNAMSLNDIKSNFLKIYEALSPNGVLLITADLAPEIKNIVDMLIEKHPAYWPIPLVEDGQINYHKKSKVVLAPRNKINNINNINDVYELFLQSGMDPQNKTLKFIKNKANVWQVIDIEEFHAGILTELLHNTGFVTEVKNEIYFAECQRVAEFLIHPDATADLEDFSVHFLSDNLNTVRIFKADIKKKQAFETFETSIAGPDPINFPVLNQNYVDDLRKRGKTLCGVQIYTIIARKSSHGT